MKKTILEKNLLRKLIRESIEKIIQEEDYFDENLPKEVKRHSSKYVGRQVTWYGDPEKMIVVHKSQVEGMWGNIYDPEKLRYLVELINNSEDNVEIECSYAIGELNSIVDVIEEQTAHHNDSFSVDYDGKKEPASTGDDELDEYLGNEEYIIDNNMTSGGEVDDFLKENRFKLIYDLKSKEQLQAEFKNVEIDENDGEDYKDENDYEAFREFIKYEEAAIEAIENNSGDIGNFTVQLRDGHHRVMGAIEAGEERVCVNVDKESLEKYSNYITKV